MNLNIDAQALDGFLSSNEDCEMIAEGEYVADFYDAEKPMTINLRRGRNGFEVLAAAYLEYDSEQDGWYMGERIEDAAVIEAAVKQAMNG